MKSRFVALGLALFLALAATAGVFLYVRGVQLRAEQSGEQVRVVVATTEIAAGAQLDPLIASGTFTTRLVRDEDVVQGAVIDIAQLRGRTAAYPILAGEQISPARLRGDEQAAGGLLGIPPDHQALTFALEPQRVVGGAIQTGDRVAVYGTFDIDFQGTSGRRVTLTRVLVPEAEVLRAATPESSGATAQANGMITLALEPYEAQLVILGQERGTVWMGLIPPHEKGVTLRPALPRKLLKLKGAA
ncbi:MAG TPA: Flp pilus assembly protein CpaB [Actinomycetota bacterium]|jgi:pilus assembly protein CpaB|nr:Flp pilus assembly protein CpaB [Actinomycetota bacterium]